MGRKKESEDNEYEEEEKIYPEIYPTIEKSAPLSPTAPVLIGGDNRINEFLLEKKKLEERLQHYQKIKKRWTKADSGIKITCLTLAGIITLSTSVLGGLTPVILGAAAGIVTGVMGGVGALQLFLGEGISVGITSKKKKIYREICEQIEHGINKLYLFQVKALEDKILTTEEIEECQRIIKEINKKIEELKRRNKSKTH